MATARVDINSDLKRKQWMHEGLLIKNHVSFWDGMTGKSSESVVYQKNNDAAGTGHTIVFDFDGNLAGKAVKNRDVAYGKGESKKKFSTSITVDRYRLPVDNGDVFDGVDIGDLSITQHSDSRTKLADLFYRFKDQALFDVAQGLTGQSPTHIIDTGSSFGYNELLTIERILRTSTGFTTGKTRRPLQPYRLQGGRDCWLFVVDAYMADTLKRDANYQSLVYNADVRGDENRAIKGVIGKIGNLIILEAPTFFGTNSAGTITFDDTSVEIAGMRQRDANGLWSGQEGYVETGDHFSRGLVLGKTALQIGFGKMPDYKFKESEDFGITSQSAVEFWMNAQKINLTAENEDYEKAKVANLDFGVVAVDVQI